MNASDLPEDPSEWPDDPFELLGCDPDTDRKELKRAYTRRIRKYKPENHPDEFRRLRDAYEWAERLVARREEFRKWQEDQRDDGEEEDSPDALPRPAAREEGQDSDAEFAPAGSDDRHEGEDPRDPPLEEPPAPRPQRLARESREQLIEAFWNEACTGDIATAHRRLVELHRERPGDEELCVRLYWLCRLAPEVDPAGDPLAWLIEGLSRAGLRGRLLELYTAHLAEDPREAVSDRCSRLLDLISPVGSIYSLVISRWRAAARLNRFEFLAQDLARVRMRFLDDDREMWIRLILAAMGYLAWEPADHAGDPLAECQREINEATDLHLKLADELDRCDLLIALADARHGLAAGMPPWPGRAGTRPDLRNYQLSRTLAAMMPVLWNAPPNIMRSWLWEWVAVLVREPKMGLEQLDVLYRASPAFLGYLAELLGELGSEPEEPEGVLADGLTLRVLSFFDFVETRSYTALRPNLAAFCVGESLPVDRIVEVLARQSYAQFAQQLHSDVAIQTLVTAHRTFWA